MQIKEDLIRNRKIAFINSLAHIRVIAALLNSIFIGLAVGINGTRIDYLILTSYLVWNILCITIPQLKNLAVKFLYWPLIMIDLLIVFYMIILTGGIHSELYSFLFLPVLALSIRCGYLGIIICCSIISVFLIGNVLILSDFAWQTLIIRIGYIYLVGMVSGFLVNQTYKVTEEVSNQLARKNDDLQLLNSHLKEVSASSDLEQIFSETLKVIQENNNSPMAAVMIFDLQGELKMVDSLGWREDWIQSYRCYPLSKYSLTLAPILVFKKPLICSDIVKHTELVQTFEGTPVKSLFAYPLVIKEEVIGALMIMDHQFKHISEEEVNIFSGIAHQASIAIQNALNLKEEKQRADTDGLTGLYNRRYFNEKIEELVYETLQKPGSNLSLILLDVDNFKKYNDTFGHPAGDQLLKKLARVVTEAVRDNDIVARYGGEEVVVILKDADNRLALQIAERVRYSVEQIIDLNCPVTVSLGVGTLPDYAKDGKSLLDFTDQSLYSAKHNGKNRVCCGF